nr:Chain P, INFLUENZA HEMAGGLUTININ HA1 (STRAIN X47) (RESIDUES 100-107) [unidentified]
YDVPDYAS